MKTIPQILIPGLVGLVVFGLMLFLAACTFDYSQAWVFVLVVFALSTWILSIYLMRENPVALQRRMHGGRWRKPNGAEGR